MQIPSFCFFVQECGMQCALPLLARAAPCCDTLPPSSHQAINMQHRCYTHCRSSRCAVRRSRTGVSRCLRRKPWGSRTGSPDGGVLFSGRFTPPTACVAAAGRVCVDPSLHGCCPVEYSPWLIPSTRTNRCARLLVYGQCSYPCCTPTLPAWGQTGSPRFR